MRTSPGQSHDQSRPLYRPGSLRSIATGFGLYAAAITMLLAMPTVLRADPTLEARGEAGGTFDDLLLHGATSTDSVTRSVSFADSSFPGYGGAAQVGGTATFGMLSGSGSASATGLFAGTHFQAEPVAAAQDYVTIFSSGSSPVDLTLHYEFVASATNPNVFRGSVDTLIEGLVSFYPSGFVDNSQIITDDKIFVAGDAGVPPGAVFAGDASLGASYSISGSTTVQVDPNATYGLYGSLGLYGQDQNLNSGQVELDIAAAGSIKYWVTFDSPDAYLESESGATYQAPGSGSSSVPDTSSTLTLLVLGLIALGQAARTRRRGIA